MRYMGSKLRIAKYIIPIINSYRTPNQTWVEPFCGGCNILDKVQGKRLGADNHHYLIELWKAVSKGWIPPNDITEDTYYQIRANPEQYDAALVGWVGFALSYGGKWLDSFTRAHREKRDFVDEAYRNALKQFPKLQGVNFIESDYKNLTLPRQCIVYCDPPYNNTAKYKTSKFDSNSFWDWVRYNSKKHIIITSEYTAPDDFTCIWQSAPICSSLTSNTGALKSVEKLFIHSSCKA